MYDELGLNLVLARDRVDNPTVFFMENTLIHLRMTKSPDLISDN